MSARPYLRLLAEAATACGGSVAMDERFRHTGIFTARSGAVYPLFGNALGVNSDAATALAGDKTYTLERLAQCGVQIPAGVLVMADPAIAAHLRRFPDAVLPGATTAQTFAQTHRYNVYIKPNSGKAGEDVHRAADTASFHRIFAEVAARHSHLRIEAPVPGSDYRAVVLDGQVRACYVRRPMGITGTGQATVAALCAALGLAQVPDIAGVSSGAILPKGQFLALRSNANISTGGTVEDQGPTPPAALAEIACRAAQAIGLRYAGVDLIAQNPHDPAGITVLEVNSAPGLDGYASVGPVQWETARAILVDALSWLR